MAPLKHMMVHSPQPMHLLRSILAYFSFPLPVIEIAPVGHHSRHLAQAVHLSLFTAGLMSECICCLPPRLERPMETFLIAPPNPRNSCPVRCDITTRASAW